jgi:hypothetical protein
MKDWEVLIQSVSRSRDRRARYYKPTCLFAVTLLFDENEVTTTEIRLEPVLKKFYQLVSPVFPNSAENGWMPFWHLTPRDHAWVFVKAGREVTKSAFPREGKPRTRVQLGRQVDYASVPKDAQHLWNSKVARAELRRKLVEMLLTDSDSVAAQAMGEYLSVRYVIDVVKDSAQVEQLISTDMPADISGHIEDYSRFRAHLVIERNQKLIRYVKRVRGNVCELCKMEFARAYGPIGRGYIEAHHCTPVSTRKGKIDQLGPKDFRVLCANCHRMIHKANLPDMEDFVQRFARPKIRYEPESL